MIKVLERILTRAATWPKAAQKELVRVAREIEQTGEVCQLATDKCEAIDEGLAQADGTECVADMEVAMYFDRRED